MGYLHTVNFGTGKTGLSTVGYTLYTNTGAIYSTRTTSGVFEFGSSGVYGANITLPDSQDVLILWDTGDSTIRYGNDDAQVQLSMIQEETSEIRKIWNSLKNQGEFISILMEKLGFLEKNLGLTKTEAESIINRGLSTIKIPEIKPFPKVPDYSALLNKLENMVESLKADINSLPKEYPSIDLSGVESALSSIRSEVSQIPKDYSSIESKVSSVEGLVKNIPTPKEYTPAFSSLEKMLNSFKEELSSISKENSTVSFNETNSIKSRIDNLNKNITQIVGFFSRIDLILQNISNINIGMIKNADDLKKAKAQIQSEIRSVALLAKDISKEVGVEFYPTKEELIASIGHRIK